MTQDEIIAMARDAKLDEAHNFDYRGCFEKMIELEKEELNKLITFAKLVAAHEREACAKVCEAHGESLANGSMLAEAIRARGQQ